MNKIYGNGNLFEGPVWDEQNEVLYWVDILERTVYHMDWKTKVIKTIRMGAYVGCLVLDRNGFPVAAVSDGLYRVDVPNQKCEKLMDSQLPLGLRYNDGKCDSHGNLWLGSMALDMTADAGKLYCIVNNQICAEYASYTIPNGLAWLNDTMFHVETVSRKIYRYKQNGVNLVRSDDDCITLVNEVGAPDGMCMDTDANLWVAMWGGSKVLCLNPKNGQVLHSIIVPDKNVSCVAFGGPSGNLLFITTAKDEEGKGGALYYMQLENRGTPSYRYGA